MTMGKFFLYSARTFVGNIDNFCMTLVYNECIRCFLKKFNFIFSCSDEGIDVYGDAANTVAVNRAPHCLPAFVRGAAGRARFRGAVAHGCTAAARSCEAAALGNKATGLGNEAAALSNGAAN